jgi:hypothetical protein
MVSMRDHWWLFALAIAAFVAGGHGAAGWGCPDVCGKSRARIWGGRSAAARGEAEQP